ncbi:uncharacterized protein L969DRAFT_104151 [Mixia osmundae IAM 14324]|uniref:Steroid 5-alpha reductase C-terminal domain-containing protein n=1 Tax=Mixia osmundae (strain CBS 9802 / IAM 14324 / JCM 22182 / KY 12970) TaxID=764103 RepID=G7DZ41_MIXOS|nr:uncharacterized protein L969DRAFT_104151 [Mixia osmundae IAM 14324]KEI38252.1 hypothetical protein L969DRAFT_104151 [Mixia osmundae IAM 14324]GAA95851.1 hypothetical protein E5Q_02508 [Mixia osmundae IAM 14324]
MAGSPVIVLDPYYLAITFLITLALQYSTLAVAYTLQFDKLTDAAGSLNFFLIALITLTFGNQYHAREIVVSVFMMIWAARLGGFLFFRVLKTGSDGRFDQIRSNLLKFAGFFAFQTLWCWTVSLPVTILNSPRGSYGPRGGANPKFGSGTDIVGIIFWVIGFSIEAISDIEKFRYKSAKPAPDQVNNKGTWGFTRHPNYFGEILLQWGIWLLCIQPARSGLTSSETRHALYASVVGPIFITLLLFGLSGLPEAEKPAAQKYYLKTYGPKADGESKAWQNYQDYLDSTSIFWPIPPAIYRPLPKWLKQTVLLDLPFYHFDERKDGPKAIEEAKQKDRESRENA